MAHRLSFFPLGNADCIRVDLENGRQILFDYAAMRDAGDPKSRIDLPTELRRDLADRERNYYDVVAFTHVDKDHIKGSSDFFELDHAAKYQGDGRIKIQELWVPAAAIIEEGCTEEARIIRTEARHRLRKGYGIRVFSRPQQLKDWLEGEGLTLDQRKPLITDAGQVIPGFSREADGLEFFSHSPFAMRQNANVVIDRNSDGLVLHATFLAAARETKVLFTADITWEVIRDIVRVTRGKKRDHRLEWDVVDIPHHCSYKALGPDKGGEITEPVDEVKWLFEQGRRGGRLISASWKIPADDADDQPPHRQAASYYRARARAITGEFQVTMEHPSVAAPKTLVINIDGLGATIEKAVGGGIGAIVSRPAPRAGGW